jgi:hypothetical protein
MMAWRPDGSRCIAILSRSRLAAIPRLMGAGGGTFAAKKVIQQVVVSFGSSPCPYSQRLVAARLACCCAS